MSSLLAGLRKLSAVSWGKGGLSLGRLSLRRPPLRRVVEAALILVLLVQAGRLVWLFAAPTPQAVEARPLPEVDLGVLSRFDAFFRNPELAQQLAHRPGKVGRLAQVQRQAQEQVPNLDQLVAAIRRFAACVTAFTQLVEV